MGSCALHDAKEALEGLDTEKIVAAYHDNFVFEDAASAHRIADKEALRAYFRRLFTLPKVAFSEVTVYEAEAFAAIEWTWSGAKPSSGEAYRVRGASVMELRDGRIARETIYYDPRAALS